MGEFDVRVQFCLAHLIRDLRFLTDLPDPATCALQGRSAFEFILQAVQAYCRNETAPSLLPAPT